MLRQFTHASLFVLALAGVSFGNSGIALAGAAPSVSVQGRAEYVSPTEIAVVVEVNCGAAASEGQVFVDASQSSAFGDASGSGITPFTSDGSRQQVTVLVTGGPMWQMGPAAATAYLYCGANFQLMDLDLGSRITIQ